MSTTKVDKECCEDWKPNIDKINGFIQTAAARANNFNIYTGIPFRFCPWCGTSVTKPKPVEVGLPDL